MNSSRIAFNLRKRIGRFSGNVVSHNDKELTALLHRHNDLFRYKIQFKHPTVWRDGGWTKAAGFFPLVEAETGGIVSFVDLRRDDYVFVSPGVEDKEGFLGDLFQEVLPGIAPSRFPFSSRFAWLDFDAYRLPMERELLSEKKEIEEEFSRRISKIDGRITENREKYDFLHRLLIETAEDLVTAVKKYLVWLGFSTVIDVDEDGAELKEEDLRIETEKGLLVIEVKGIGGTSKDSDCSQISKIRYRRMKQRRAVDVAALYIVNHQRHLPPEDRDNPPFKEKQIEDVSTRNEVC